MGEDSIWLFSGNSIDQPLSQKCSLTAETKQWRRPGRATFHEQILSSTESYRYRQYSALEWSGRQTAHAIILTSSSYNYTYTLFTRNCVLSYLRAQVDEPSSRYGICIGVNNTCRCICTCVHTYVTPVYTVQKTTVYRNNISYVPLYLPMVLLAMCMLHTCLNSCDVKHKVCVIQAISIGPN